MSAANRATSSLTSADFSESEYSERAGQEAAARRSRPLEIKRKLPCREGAFGT